MIIVRTNLRATPETTIKTVVMEMDAQSAFYLSTVLLNIQGESEDIQAFCTLLGKHLYENGNKAR